MQKFTQVHEKIDGETTAMPIVSNGGEPPFRPAVSNLCALCSRIFRNLGPESEQLTLKFCTTPKLMKAKPERCAFCTLILNSVQISQHRNRVPDGKALLKTRSRRPLTARIQFYQDLGLTFILWRKKQQDWCFITEITMRTIDAQIWFEHHIRMSESASTPSQRMWDQITDWVQTCRNSHDECCNSRLAEISDIQQLPARLLEVGEIDSPSVRLRETSVLNLSVANKYMTLSHCWGDVVPKKLLSTNYLILLDGILVSDLPATFAEAVQLTRSLRVSYLWIDSLCIIQDSPEDWQMESSRMFHVYRNSHLNIGAAVSKDANGGLFSSLEPQTLQQCVLAVGGEDNPLYVGTQYHPENDLERNNKCVLFTRAWVFQELFLAPRTLFFGKDELFWECRRLRGTETIPRQKNCHPGYDGLRKAMRELWETLDDQDYQHRLGLWCEIVRQYSDKQLTKVSDKLVAVSGLASRLGRAWHDVTYLAGLWSFQLRRGLLWRLTQPQLQQQRTFTAPSWSWASTTGTITSSGFHSGSTLEEKISDLRDGLVQILDAKITHASPSSLYGEVTGGCIRIKGPLFKAKVVKLRLFSWELHFSHIVETIPLQVEWDHWEMNDMAEAVNIYLSPFEIYLTSRGQLRLEGVLLLPTHSREGEYRRLGFFSVQDNLLRSLIQPSEDIKSSRTTHSIQGNDRSGKNRQHSDTSSTPPLRVTVLDVTEVTASLEKEDLQKIESEFSSGNGRFERMKRKLDAKQDHHYPCSNVTSSESTDPYWNGVVNTTLLDRYHGTLEETEYPNISSFLTATDWTIYKEGLVGGSQVSHEEDHGNAYFTFSII